MRKQKLREYKLLPNSHTANRITVEETMPWADQTNSFYLLEGSELLNDYDLTKAHETENVDGTEGPANEDEDIGGEP